MSIHQLDFRCWVLDDPSQDEGERHFKDAAGVNAALSGAREDDPGTKASARQLDAPCWLVQCDGDCEQVIDEYDEGYVYHHESRAEAEKTVRIWEWTLVPGTLGGELAYCHEDRPEDAEPPPPSAAELEAAGQMPLPGLPEVRPS